MISRFDPVIKMKKKVRKYLKRCFNFPLFITQHFQMKVENIDLF